jgi:hypothetical protein
LSDSERLDRLKPLAWLIGEWAVEKGGNSAMVVKSEWAANKKFIHLRYMIKKAGSEELDSQQIIGWDPRREQIVSWILRLAWRLWLRHSGRGATTSG